MQKWWTLEQEKTVTELTTNQTTGLSEEETKKRQEIYGPNQLQEAKGRSPIQMFFDQFKDFIIWVLIGAAIISGFLGEWVDTGAIVAIVILNAVLGFVQEFRAEKSLAALKKLSSPMTKVIRSGKHAIIPSQELVPGDLIELEAGDKIPSDSRILYASPQCATQEASLTGESLPVQKNVKSLPEDAPLAERKNMVYMGTPMVAGKARAVVAETGMQTELGKIAGMIQQIEDTTTPLQRKLEEFGKWIVYVCFAVVALVFALGMLRGGKLVDMFLTAVTLAVAAIPEGLPAVVTVSLALGVQKMVFMGRCGN